MDRKYVLTALGYGVLGMALGVYMGISQNHAQHVTHAHILLLGMVVSFIYAIIHKLWITDGTTTLSRVQYYCHQVGILVMFIGLFCFYQGLLPGEKIGPVLSLASVVVFAGVVLMKVLFIKSTRKAG